MLVRPLEYPSVVRAGRCALRLSGFKVPAHFERSSADGLVADWAIRGQKYLKHFGRLTIRHTRCELHLEIDKFRRLAGAQEVIHRRKHERYPMLAFADRMPRRFDSDLAKNSVQRSFPRILATTHRQATRAHTSKRRIFVDLLRNDFLLNSLQEFSSFRVRQADLGKLQGGRAPSNRHDFGAGGLVLPHLAFDLDRDLHLEGRPFRSLFSAKTQE